MRKELLITSLMAAILVSYGCADSAPLFFLALLSLITLIYAYIKDRRAPLFPVILGVAFAMNSFVYPWDLPHMLILSALWPGIFSLFALHSVPESPDMEKNVLLAWSMAFTISISALYLIPGMVSSVPDPVFLAIVGLVAGLAMAYLAWR